jgi:hypothetical protein
LLLHAERPPWVAHSDIRQARKLASIICTSDAAIDAYLKFASEEAKAIICNTARRFWQSQKH